MKVKSKTLYTWAIALLLLLDINFFYLISQPDFLGQYNSMYNKALIAIISLILGGVCLGRHGSFFREYKYVKNYCMLVTVLSVLLIVHGLITYSQSILSLLRNCDYLLIGFLAIPILYTLRDERSFYSFMKLLNVYAGIWYFLIIVQSILYTATGSMFLNYFTGEYVWYRNGVRISLFSVGSLMVYYNFYMAFDEFQSRSHRLKYFIMLIVGVYATLFVQQTRSIDFAMVLAFAIMYLMKSKNAKRTLQNYGIVIVAFAALWFSGVLGSFFASFFAGSNYIRSTTLRQEAFLYFAQYWVKHPLFGMGLTNNEVLTRGPIGRYYMSDVGFVGVLAKTGIAAFVLYGSILWRWFKIIGKLRKSTDARYKSISVLLIGLAVYFIAPVYAMSVYANAYCISIPIMIAIFEYWNWDYNTSKDK